jgi:N-formylglutamate amidohydrolase
MAAAPAPGGCGAPVELLMPSEQTMPIVFASPHSGADYPAEFVAASRLDPVALRRSEDSFVDEIFGAAPAHGAPLVRARFPRAYVDVNREPYELDPGMFEDALPSYANTASPRVAAGLGTIARVVASGEEIYARKLRFAEARGRIDRCYRPYHQTLSQAIAATRQRFGTCLLIDCHSMPSPGRPAERNAGGERVDIVLGDCYASSCAAPIIDTIEEMLRSLGYVVTRNLPYSGGFVTQHYGRPSSGVHALQVEINRALYMDEAAIRHGPGFGEVARRMTRLIDELRLMAGALLAA